MYLWMRARAEAGLRLGVGLLSDVALLRTAGLDCRRHAAFTPATQQPEQPTRERTGRQHGGGDAIDDREELDDRELRLLCLQRPREDRVAAPTEL